MGIIHSVGINQVGIIHSLGVNQEARRKFLQWILLQHFKRGQCVSAQEWKGQGATWAEPEPSPSCRTLISKSHASPKAVKASKGMICCGENALLPGGLPNYANVMY